MDMDILKSLKLGSYILKISRSKKGFKISFLPIFGYRIGYKYPLIYILPMSDYIYYGAGAKCNTG
jgi:hypothetical protein